MTPAIPGPTDAALDRQPARTQDPPPAESEGGPVAVVPLSRALHTLSTVALATSGGALFGTPVVMLIAQRSVVNAIDVATVAMLAAVWLTALAIPSLQVRAAVQTAIGIVLVASPLLLGSASGGPWMPVTLVGFAIVVGAVFALSRNAAFVIVLVVALVQAAVLRIAPTGAAFTGNGWALIAGPLLTVLAGTGLVLAFDAWRREVDVLDDRERDLERAQEATEQQVRVQRARDTVERRVHETVLNTLTGISMGAATAELARRRAQRDLEQLDLGLQPLGDTPLGNLIDLALASSGADEIPHDIRLADDQVLPGPTATVLRDALVEVFRNVVRHAQAHHLRVEARAGADITVLVGDDGVGMSAETVERFGMGSAIRRGIASIGGSVRIQSEPGCGTTVTLRAPRLAEAPAVAAPTDATSLLDDSRASRLGLLGTNVFLALLAIPLALALPPSLVTGLAIAGFIAGNAVLAWWWTPSLRRWLPPLIVASGVIAVIAPTLRFDPVASCAASDATPWLIAGISGGGALLLISAYRSLLARLVVVAVIGVATIWLSLAMDGSCRDFTLLSALVTLVYMAAIAGFLTWIDLRFDAQRRRRVRLWHDIVVSRADIASREAAAEQWNALTASARSLLEGLASGALDPADPAVRAEADTEGSQLRSRIGRRREEIDALSSLLDRIRPLARARTCAVEVTQIASWQGTDPLPSWVGEAIVAMIDPGSCPRLELIALHDEGCDELLIRCAPAAVSTFISMLPSDTGGYAVTVESLEEGDEGMLSIRREAADPLAPTGGSGGMRPRG